MTKSAIASRNYLLYLIGNTISLHGLWIYRVALGWYAWELSESEFWVGVVAFTQFAPAVIFGPLFGVLADRFDRRAASLLINSTSILNMLLLGLLALLGYVDIYVLTMLSLMQGTLDGAHMPVRMSVVPNLVSKDQLESAIAISEQPGTEVTLSYRSGAFSRSKKKNRKKLEELLALGFMRLANIALAHAAQGGIGIQTGIMPVTPFKSKGISPNRLHILQ